MSNPRTRTLMVVLVLVLLTAHAQPPRDVWIGLMYRLNTDRYFGSVFEFVQEVVNNSTDILPNTTLHVRYLDTDTDHPYTVNSNAVSLILGQPALDETDNRTYPRPVAIIGGVYSPPTLKLASITSAYQVPTVGIICQSTQFRDRDEYPFFVRAFPDALSTATATARLLQHHNWKNVLVLHTDDVVARRYVAAVREQLCGEECDPSTVNVESVVFRTSTKADTQATTKPWAISAKFNASIEAAVKTVAASRVNIVVLFSMSGREVLWETMLNHSVLATKQVVTNDITGYVAKPRHLKGVFKVSRPAVNPHWQLGNQYAAALNKTLFYIHPPGLSSMMMVASALHDLFYSDNSAYTDVEDIRGPVLLQALKETQLEPAWESNSVNQLTADGGRAIDLVVYNYDLNSKESLVGNWTYDTRELTLLSELTYFGDQGLVPPEDRTVFQEFVHLTISSELKAGIYVVMGLSTAVMVLLLVFNVVKRGTTIIRMSSPNFNTLILIGGLVLLSTAFVALQDTGTVSEDVFVSMCYTKWWMLSLGFSLFFGSLLAKTFRVWLIFRSRDIGPVEVPDSRLAGLLSVLMLLDVVLLVALHVASPLSYEQVSDITPVNADGVELITYWDGCTSDHVSVFLTIFISVKAILLASGVFLALATRHVSIPVLNDSRLIGFSIYNTVLMVGIIIPLVWMLGGSVSQSNLDSSFALHQFGLCACVMSSVCLIFIPKMYHVIRGSNVRMTTPRTNLTRTSRNTSRRTRTFDNNSSQPSEAPGAKVTNPSTGDQRSTASSPYSSSGGEYVEMQRRQRDASTASSTPSNSSTRVGEAGEQLTTRVSRSHTPSSVSDFEISSASVSLSQ